MTSAISCSELGWQIYRKPTTTEIHHSGNSDATLQATYPNCKQPRNRKAEKDLMESQTADLPNDDRIRLTARSPSRRLCCGQSCENVTLNYCLAMQQGLVFPGLIAC